jgi:hypothetical protein
MSTDALTSRIYPWTALRYVCVHCCWSYNHDGSEHTSGISTKWMCADDGIHANHSGNNALTNYRSNPTRTVSSISCVLLGIEFAWEQRHSAAMAIMQ